MHNQLLFNILKRFSKDNKVLHLFLIRKDALLYSLKIEDEEITFPDKLINLPKFAIQDEQLLKTIIKDKLKASDLNLIPIQYDNQIYALYALKIKEEKNIDYQRLEELAFLILLIQETKDFKTYSSSAEIKAAKLLSLNLAFSNLLLNLFNSIHPDLPLKEIFQVSEKLLISNLGINLSFLHKKHNLNKNEFWYNTKNFLFYRGKKPFSEQEKLILKIISNYLHQIIEYKKLKDNQRLIEITYSQFFIDSLLLIILCLHEKKEKTERLIEAIFKTTKRLLYLSQIPNEEIIDVKELMQEIADYLIHSITWCDIKILPPKESTKIKAIKPILFLFLVKLILNKVFKMDEGKITLKGYIQDNKVKISITDTSNINFGLEFAQTPQNKSLIFLKDYLKKHTYSFQIKPKELILTFNLI